VPFRFAAPTRLASALRRGLKPSAQGPNRRERKARCRSRPLGLSQLPGVSAPAQIMWRRTIRRNGSNLSRRPWPSAVQARRFL